MAKRLVLQTDESIKASMFKQITSSGSFTKNLFLTMAICLSMAAAVPDAWAQDAKHAAIHRLTMEAMHVEDTEDLNQAETLYVKAL